MLLFQCFPSFHVYFCLSLLSPVPGAPPQNITLEVVLSRVSSTLPPWPTLYMSISLFCAYAFPTFVLFISVVVVVVLLPSLQRQNCLPLLLSLSKSSYAQRVAVAVAAVVFLSRFSTWFGKCPSSGGDSFNAAKQIISLPFICSASASQKITPRTRMKTVFTQKRQTTNPPKKMKEKAKKKKKDWVLL